MKKYFFTIALLFSVFIIQSWTIKYKSGKKLEPTPMVFAEFFSPNNDGNNDYFVIKNIEEYPINKIHIFNRWGDKVYTAEPYKNDWDGVSNASTEYFGSRVPDGTYFFRFEYLLGDFEEQRGGKIILMR